VAVQNATQVADARYRGFKNVVSTPSRARSFEAHEWIPIRVAPTGRWLSVCQRAPQRAGHLRPRVPDVQDHGPYLIRPATALPPRQGDQQTAGLGPVDKRAKVHNDASVTGSSTRTRRTRWRWRGLSSGRRPVPARFRAPQGHVKKYTRREWRRSPGCGGHHPARGQGVRRGCGDRIDGDHPDRQGASQDPSARWPRTSSRSQGHVNSGWTCLSIDLVNHMVARRTPGARLWTGRHGHERVSETASPTRFPIPARMGCWSQGVVYDTCLPMRVPKQPTRSTCTTCFRPPSTTPSSSAAALVRDPGRFKIPTAEVMINFGSNSVMTMATPSRSPRTSSEVWLRGLVQLSSRVRGGVADVVLPDACYLERYTRR